MGGPGSGTWMRRDAKATTSCLLPLNVNWLARDGYLSVGVNGVLQWNNCATHQPLGSAEFSVLPSVNNSRIFQIRYHWNNSENVCTSIRLQPTQPHFGGQRWWLTCPLSVNGTPCNRRVAKLYLHGRYFGCRFCHDLTYQSCRESHSLQRMFDCLTRIAGGLPVNDQLADCFDHWIRRDDG